MAERKKGWDEAMKKEVAAAVAAAAAAVEGDVSVPKCIECPITMDVFRDPVTSKLCGHTFEKDSILKLVRTMRAAPCPMCRFPVFEEALVRDGPVRKEAERFREFCG